MSVPSEVTREESWLLLNCWIMLRFHQEGKNTCIMWDAPSPWTRSYKEGSPQVERTLEKGDRRSSSHFYRPYRWRNRRRIRWFNKARKSTLQEQAENFPGRNLIGSIWKNSKYQNRLKHCQRLKKVSMCAQAGQRAGAWQQLSDTHRVGDSNVQCNSMLREEKERDANRCIGDWNATSCGCNWCQCHP